MSRQWTFRVGGTGDAPTFFVYRGPTIGIFVGDTFEDEADAKLIAAAPELLDALNLFMTQYDACGPNSNFGRIFANVKTAAAQAVAKAKG